MLQTVVATVATLACGDLTPAPWFDPSHGVIVTPSPRCFELTTPPFRLEGGAVLPHHHLRGFWWGPDDDLSWLASRSRLLPADDPSMHGEAPVVRDAPLDVAPDGRTPRSALDLPTVLVVHALTADARVGGEGGWWGPVVGRGEPLDPSRMRILCFNNLGSCYGTFGPADAGFPTAGDETAPPTYEGKGAFVYDPRMPATVTTWDQARSILLGLDALGIGRVDMVTGGSVGGMVTLCLASLAPERFARVVPVATAPRSTSWIRGWNHIARMAILGDPGYPDDPWRGLEIARQIAHVTYRAEPGLADQDLPHDASAPWHGQSPLRIQTYLEHQGRKLRARFSAAAYLAQLSAMDHHDISRSPGEPEPCECWAAGGPWGEARLRSATYAVGIDSDQLFLATHGQRLVARLRSQGVPADGRLIRSPHGHDAFLLEWAQLRAAMRAAWAMTPVDE